MSLRRREAPEDGSGPAHGAAVHHVTVATTGAAVMVLEVLGTRVIAPFYGVGLFVWTALLAVTLVSLALGYRVGGVFADRRGPGGLSPVIAGAAVLTALIPVARPVVLRLTDPLGLRLGSLAAALVLFAGPLTLLGMVGPYVIRLRTRRIESVGATSGVVLAVSTCGSVAGTLLVGFVLMPRLGTRSILLGTSGALLLLAAAVLVDERRRRRSGPGKGVLVAATVLCTLAGSRGRAAPTASDARFQLVHEAESHYGRVRVVDEVELDLRWMLVDASVIGAMYKGTTDVPFPYLYALESLVELRPQARHALVIGLGAGYLPGALARLGLAVDTIEIDPEVVRAAHDYFGFQPPGRLLVGDARYEVRRLASRYDVIVHDCFTGGEMPSHLFSVEMLETLRDHLEPGGILATNFFGLNEGVRVSALSAVASTLDAVFPHRVTLAPVPGKELFDRLFVVSDRPLPLPAGGGTQPLSEKARAALVSLPSLVTALPAVPGLVVTDDDNPLELLQLRKSEAYGRLLREHFGTDLLAE
jgi:predicted membrane-bound spermidine synthase